MLRPTETPNDDGLTTVADLYETDPYAWTLTQADALRELARGRRDAALDLPHLIEELEAMAGGDRRRVENLAQAVMEHLLLLEHSPAVDPRRHWRGELVGFRRQLRRGLGGVLREHLADRLDEVFEAAREDVAAKMRVYGEDRAAERLPQARPYTLEQVLGPWLPEERPPAEAS